MASKLDSNFSFLASPRQIGTQTQPNLLNLIEYEDTKIMQPFAKPMAYSVSNLL